MVLLTHTPIDAVPMMLDSAA